MSHQRPGDSSMGRRTYLTLGLTAAAGAVGVGSTRAMATNDPAPTDIEIGGGAEYDRHVTPADADVIVSTREGLLSALETGSKTVYIADNATIDLSARRITIPGDVTLASGRGRNGSPGALITADRRASRLFQVFEEGVRITGLRFRGHRVGYYDPPGDVWNHNSLAIRAYADCEIDNCELYGWTFAAIGIGRHGSDPLDSDAHVHHCSIHDNMMTGLGYGIVVYRGDPVLEYNYFDRNRHSIAAGGQTGCRYEARYNIQGPTNLLFGFEMHNPGGDRIDIHHNTFELVERRDGRATPAVAIRGIPSDGASVRNNWFYNPTDPGDDRYLDGSPIVQYGNGVSGSEWNGVALSENHFGEDEPEPGIGHPRGGDGPNASETAQLRVYVRERDVEEHLEGATVEIEPHSGTDMSGYDGPLTAETEAGEEYFGAYARFDDLPVGRYDVRASHPAYEPGSVTDLELDPSGRQPPISLEPREVDVLTIAGQGDIAHYEFSVDLADGEIEKSTEYGATINDYDTIEGSTVRGRTTREPDSFAFVGEVTSFEADAPVDLLLNGEAVDPDDLGPTERVLTIAGRGELAQYEFSVDLASGEVEKSTEYGGTINSYDTIEGSTVRGRTTREPDSFVFTGEVRSFEADAPVDVSLDGEAVDPSELGADEPTDSEPIDLLDPIDDGQVITLEGGSVANPTHYLFEVSGHVLKSDANGATVDDADEISGRTVAGILRGERDSYVIPAGDAITGFITLGELSVRIDGTDIPSGDVLSYFD